MKLRFRWFGAIEQSPMIGQYLMSARRPRGGYLILGSSNKGKRGGMGGPVYFQLALTVERVSVEECRRGECFILEWDKRRRRRA